MTESSEPITQTIRVRVAYEGSDYSGWQTQKNAARTIQSEIEKGLQKILNLKKIHIIGSGRTDAGVHALDQNFHFKIKRDLKDFRLVRALNGVLPGAIGAKKAWIAPEGFHALASAAEKKYVYRIWNSIQRPVLNRRLLTWHPKPLDLETLKKLTEPLKGEHDFKSFQSSGTPVRTTVRRLDYCEWTQEGPLICFEVRGPGFLKQMVRNLVGTILDLHKRGNGPEETVRILDAKDRRIAGRAAPPQGLLLARVSYPDEIEKACIELP